MSGETLPEVVPEMTVAELEACGRSLEVPFVLGLEDGSGISIELRCVEMLRLLPGRRLVVRCIQAGQERVLKLFLGSSAPRYCTRERAGVLTLARCGVPTPALVGEPVNPSGSGWGLLFEYLDGAQPVEESDDQTIDQIAAMLGKLHERGAWHNDLHLNNFVTDSQGKVYAIDGDGVRAGKVRARPLGARASLNNLALLLAQLPPLNDARLMAPLGCYALVRKWLVPSLQSFESFESLTKRQRCLRVRRYLKKTQRTCTEFFYAGTLGSRVLCERVSWTEAMAAFVAEPEKSFNDADVLKAGNSATVVRARIGRHGYIIKRYNVKSLWHGVRRALKPTSRFRLAWCNGHRLAFLRIPTARPVALVEQRSGLVRRVAYLVMKDLGDNNLITEIAKKGLSESLIEEVTELFCALQAAELTHGDMKATNFLCPGPGSGQKVSLIDLDSMREGSAGLGRDVRRFLSNWDEQHEIQETFRRALVAAGLPVAG